MDSSLVNFMAAATRTWPPEGSVGVESEWMTLGRLIVRSGALWIGDPTSHTASDGVTVPVSHGEYLVDAKGMDFDGHRRVSRLQATLDGAPSSVVDRVASVAVDSGMVSVADADDVHELFAASRTHEIRDAVFERSMRGGGMIEIRDMPNVGKIATVFAGFGDGSYPLFSSAWKRQPNGIHVAFIEKGSVG